MTNKERQKSLDKKKWLESEKKGEDMSGQMGWCPYCEHFDSDVSWFHQCIIRWCTATQEEREKQCLCAKAYNRMVRRKP